jgi:hypothetical protein
MTRATVFSEDRVYRYQLWRQQFHALHYVLFIGLNPSTADETKDDPTIRRCVGFTNSWGYGALCMANLFAFRATNPKVMMASKDPIGVDNDEFIKQLAEEAALIICAWGNGGNYKGRAREVIGLLNPVLPKVMVLGVNADGSPKHPLYLKSDCKPIRFDTARKLQCGETL